jgi:hypothetical protein
MKKSNGYYLKSYLKNNWLVLVCELVIVVLLALICTILIGGQPAWLTPVMALTAYLLAEIRFMMAYIATLATKAQETGDADEEAEEDDLMPVSVTEPEATEEISQDEVVTEPADECDEAGAEVSEPEVEEVAEAVEKPAEPALPAEVPVVADAARVDEPDGDDVFISLDDESDLPTSKTLDLDEGM